jgi:hypothetical protein
MLRSYEPPVINSQDQSFSICGPRILACDSEYSTTATNYSVLVLKNLLRAIR